MAVGRDSHTATLLLNGKVLIVGGPDHSGTGAWASAELYNPSTGTFSPTGSMIIGRYRHTATRLASGKVLITGGFDGLVGLSSAELYDPSTGTFNLIGDMTSKRLAHTATPLPNGKVLITGGSDGHYELGSAAFLATAELFDPSTEMFAITGAMGATRFTHAATLLPSGKVLVTG